MTRESPPRVFDADLPAAATELSVPEEFVERGAEYKVEVAAIETSGNRTFQEVGLTAG